MYNHLRGQSSVQSTCMFVNEMIGNLLYLVEFLSINLND